MKPGKILVSFDWAGRLGMDITVKRLDLKLNGKILKNFKAIDTKLNK